MNSDQNPANLQNVTIVYNIVKHKSDTRYLSNLQLENWLEELKSKSCVPKNAKYKAAPVLIGDSTYTLQESHKSVFNCIKCVIIYNLCENIDFRSNDAIWMQSSQYYNVQTQLFDKSAMLRQLNTIEPSQLLAVYKTYHSYLNDNRDFFFVNNAMYFTMEETILRENLNIAGL